MLVRPQFSLILLMMLSSVAAWTLASIASRSIHNNHDWKLRGTATDTTTSEESVMAPSKDYDTIVGASFEEHGPENILPPESRESDSRSSRTIFPIDLVVGHSLVKQALEIVAVTGTSLVIAGPTGTCKSILARSMQLLLPEAPAVYVPSTAAEDALTGSVDIERSLETGTPVFQPGVLTKADGAILVMDDINLMDVSTASVLFKALVDGSVHVEREGVSVEYPCRPVATVATYNDLYEELREHFIDRFALQVTTMTSEDASVRDRVQGVLNVEAFVDFGSSRGLGEMSSSWQQRLLLQAAVDEQARCQRIVKAKEMYPAVQLSKQQTMYLCKQATAWDCEGQRAEIFAGMAARAAAALDGRELVHADDLELAVKLCIAPRGRVVIVAQDAGATQDSSQQQQQTPETQPIPPSPDMVHPEEQEQTEEDRSEMEDSSQEEEPQDTSELEGPEPLMIPEEFMFGVDSSIAIDPRLLVFQKRSLGKGRRAGKRSRKFNIERGRFVKAIFPTEHRRGRLAVGATLRAAAPHQLLRRKRRVVVRPNDKRIVIITKDDFRIQQLKKKTGSLVIFLVDASGSMALNRMAAAKG
jgi:magnesium chelatase subunit D